MKISLIRHFETEGNRLHRYIGVTDEPLAKGAKEGTDRASYPEADLLFVSPLIRCRQTADFLYPDVRKVVVSTLRECDFGVFENKNYKELSDEPRYQAWVDSEGTLPFPEGESREEFVSRTVKAFYECLSAAEQEGMAHIAFIVHGGTVMSIMEAVTKKEGSYYDWQVRNGGGFLIELKEGEVLSIETIQGKRK